MHRAIAVIEYRCVARCGVFPVNFGKMKRDSPVKERHVLVTHRRQNVDIEPYRALFSAEHRRPFLGKGLFRFPVVFGEPEVDEGIGGEVVGPGALMRLAREPREALGLILRLSHVRDSSAGMDPGIASVGCPA